MAVSHSNGAGSRTGGRGRNSERLAYHRLANSNGLGRDSSKRDGDSGRDWNARSLADRDRSVAHASTNLNGTSCRSSH